MDYSETCFFPMFGRFGGVKRLLKGKDFRYSILFATFLCLISWHFSISEKAISELSLIFITVGAALVAVIITGLAIIVSTSDNDFVALMEKVGIYENVLFPFWLSSVVSGIGITFNIISYVLTLINTDFVISINGENYLANNIVFTFLLFFSLFSMIYALFMVITLIENAIKYGLYRGTFRVGGGPQK